MTPLQVYKPSPLSRGEKKTWVLIYTYGEVENSLYTSFLAHTHSIYYSLYAYLS